MMKLFALLICLLGFTAGLSAEVTVLNDPGILARPGETLVLFDVAGDRFWVSDQSAVKLRHSPCSTFKIISTLTALECGAAAGADDRQGYDGKVYEYTAWNRDLTLREAFRSSCVWYYQKLVAKIPKTVMQQTLDRLHYGNSDLSAWDHAGHHTFWIMSGLQISPLEQVVVLDQIFGGKSAFAPAHVELVKSFMLDDAPADGLRFYAKTGTGRQPETGKLAGWCVGFGETAGGRRIYYAVFISDTQKDVTGLDAKAAARIALTAILH